MAVTGQAGTARSSASAGRSLIMSIGAEQREASVQALDDLLRASALVQVLVNVGP
jgi:hypothetical protein